MISQAFKSILRIPIVGHCVLLIYRTILGLRYLSRPYPKLLKWLFRSRETTNFTYDLTADNKKYLAALVSHITRTEFETIFEYILELERDDVLRAHLADATQASPQGSAADRFALYGKRIGWYAIARAMKPAIIVETGVDKGLGSCVMAAAIKRNREEGYSGRYFGTDISKHAGYLLSGPYAEYGEILYGDSLKSLEQFDGEIDLFINDSDHSRVYEAKEYETVRKKLSNRAILLGDNCHTNDALFEFSRRNNRQFIFFREEPLDHWYPGGGIGISFVRQQEL